MNKLQEIKDQLQQLTEQVQELMTEEEDQEFDPKSCTFWQHEDGELYYLCKLNDEYALISLMGPEGSQNWTDPAGTLAGAFDGDQEHFTQIFREDARKLL